MRFSTPALIGQSIYSGRRRKFNMAEGIKMSWMHVTKIKWGIRGSISFYSIILMNSFRPILPSCDWSNLKFALPCLEVATAPHCIKKHIVASNDRKPDLIYASLWLAFHSKCALSARKCIALYRLKFQIIHCQFFFWIRLWCRTYGVSDLWGVGLMGCRTYGVSDLRGVGLTGCRSYGVSDLWHWPELSGKRGYLKGNLCQISEMSTNWNVI